MEDTTWGTEEEGEILLASVLWVRGVAGEKPGRWPSPRLLDPGTWCMAVTSVLLSTEVEGNHVPGV